MDACNKNVSPSPVLLYSFDRKTGADDLYVSSEA